MRNALEVINQRHGLTPWLTPARIHNVGAFRIAVAHGLHGVQLQTQVKGAGRQPEAADPPRAAHAPVLIGTSVEMPVAPASRHTVT